MIKKLSFGKKIMIFIAVVLFAVISYFALAFFGNPVSRCCAEFLQKNMWRKTIRTAI